MAVAEPVAQPAEQQVDKGLKAGALGLVSTTIIATASVAPAYSIAATLVFVVGAVALQSPAVAVLAFVPMLLTSIGYSELNKADPDCGTTFTWATRAFKHRCRGQRGDEGQEQDPRAGGDLVDVHPAVFYCKFRNPAFFKGQTLTRSTETLVPDPDA
jgi:hypothetical protein